MTKNPFLNSLAAFTYIFLLSIFMNWGSKNLASTPDTFLAPIAAISMFTLSAAVMFYIFCYQPIQLYFDNKKKVAVKLFLQTVAIFAAITITFVSLLFAKII